jgi:hypothetical protein
MAMKTIFQRINSCVVDNRTLQLPVTDTVINANPDPVASPGRMAAGPTGSFLLMLKTTKAELNLPQSFESL